MNRTSIFTDAGSDIHRLDSQKADKYEIHSINSDISRLEHSMREACASIEGLRYEVQTLQQEVARLKELSGIC